MSVNEAEQGYFTVQQVAHYTGRSEGAVRQMIYKGELPVCRLGARVFVEKTALDNLFRAVPSAREIKK